MKSILSRVTIILLSLCLVAHSTSLFELSYASSTDGTIDPNNVGNQYAWSDNLGWINFGTGVGAGDIHITSAGITGHAWSDNYGWINMAPTGAGVTFSTAGNLTGSAWGENTGYIDFSAVSIDSVGLFMGTATGTIAGTINFNCPTCVVETDYRIYGGGGRRRVEISDPPAIEPENEEEDSEEDTADVDEEKESDDTESEQKESDENNLDTDGDGIPNNEDADIDNDKILNLSDLDIDGDGIPNSEDDDADGDEIPNESDDSAYGIGTQTDVDGDGIENALDEDVDGDGILNNDDEDINGNGIINRKDRDMDSDGKLNTEDDDRGFGSRLHGSANFSCSDNLIDIADEANHDAIYETVNKNYFLCRETGRFEPNGLVTRADMIKLVSIGLGREISHSEKGEWYANWLRFLLRKKIVKREVSPERYEPRADILALVLKAKGIDIEKLPACVSQPFMDVPSTSWFCPVIVKAQEEGIIPYDGFWFNPFDLAKRNWTAGVIHGAFEL
jgi:hypothetical protein